MKTREEIYETHDALNRQIYDRYDCDCAELIATRRTVGERQNITVWMQCRNCGRAVRSVKKADYDIDSLPCFEEGKRDQRWERRSRDFEAERQRYECELESLKEQQSAQWWANYNHYLKSRQWHTLRQKVLERDGNLCQACLSRQAAQVHHLSYELYNLLEQSAAFECVAICHQCHAKIHPHMAELQHHIVASGYNPYLNGAYNGR